MTVVPPEVWRMAAVISLAGFMSLLDTTIVNVALQTIGHHLHSTLPDTQWLVTGYLLATAATLPIAGWAARRYGARRVFLTSVVLFTASSALCGAADSVGELIAFRVLQGIGGAALLPVGQAALTKRAGSHNVARMMGVVGGPMFLAPILGPTIGGALVDGPGWRWIFYVNVPIGAIAIVLVLRYFILDEDAGREYAGPLDVLGLGLLSTGLVGLMYGISEIGILNEIVTSRVLIPFIVGAGLSVAFLVHARRATRPLLDTTLYRDRSYLLASVIMAIGGAAIFGSQIIVALFFQEVRGQSALHTGLALIPQGLGAVTAMIITGPLTTRLGGGRAAMLGGAIGVLSTVPFILVGAHTPYLLLAPVLYSRGLGLALSCMPAMTAALIRLKPSQIHDATPQLDVLQRLGGSAGVAILTVVLSRQIAGSHQITGNGLAQAFNTTWGWSLAIALIGLLPAGLLAFTERSHRKTMIEQDSQTKPVRITRKASGPTRSLPQSGMTAD